jgi:peptidoglycan hydrolase CwlO-like protein
LPPEPELHATGSTDQLLQATERNLRRLTRQLTPAEQGMVDEIKNYMQRARSAQTDGDANLARNYALKAHQLSDVLVQ